MQELFRTVQCLPSYYLHFPTFSWPFISVLLYSIRCMSTNAWLGNMSNNVVTCEIVSLLSAIETPLKNQIGLICSNLS